MEHLIAFSKLKEIKVFSNDTYYCPFSLYQATFGGFTWESNTKLVTLFQMTVSEEHDINLKGINDLSETLGRQAKTGYKFRYVVMVPEGRPITIVTPLQLPRDPDWSEYIFEVPDSVMNPSAPVAQ
jgi:hypothetical protein